MYYAVSNCHAKKIDNYKWRVYVFKKIMLFGSIVSIYYSG